jgi:hypothetical protein
LCSSVDRRGKIWVLGPVGAILMLLWLEPGFATAAAMPLNIVVSCVVVSKRIAALLLLVSRGGEVEKQRGERSVGSRS